MAQTLESLIEREFEEVRKAREDLLAKRAAIDEQLSGLERRLQAAENYRATLEGKFAPPTRERKPRAPSSRAHRGAREEIKTKIVALVRQRPEGLIAAQITEALNATEVREKQQIANLLAFLKKEGVLHQEARRGPYFVPQEEGDSPAGGDTV